MAVRTIAVASALVASTLGQSSTVTNMFLMGFEGQNIVASVMSVAPEATTYFMSCAPGTDGSDCGFGPGYTIVEGPSTFGAHVTEQDAFTMDVQCSLSGDTASCIETDAGPEANDPGTRTSIVSGISDQSLPVTITAGLDLLSASTTASGASSTTGTAEPSSTASSGASATGRAEATSSTGTSSTGTGTSTSTSTSTSTGGVPRATQNAVIAGVVVLVGGALVL